MSRQQNRGGTLIKLGSVGKDRVFDDEESVYYDSEDEVLEEAASEEGASDEEASQYETAVEEASEDEVSGDESSEYETADEETSEYKASKAGQDCGSEPSVDGQSVHGNTVPLDMEMFYDRVTFSRRPCTDWLFVWAGVPESPIPIDFFCQAIPKDLKQTLIDALERDGVFLFTFTTWQCRGYYTGSTKAKFILARDRVDREAVKD
ncbi:hypothetical protein QQX98_009614 [Neonectria punicea]|uniref:Uncharacterized protein n=1 Tax=Neonectria punicea TaxID=979145 RepID=A0ABR1GS45_9HYPO